MESCISSKNATWAIRKIIEAREQVVRASGLQGNLQTRLAACAKGSKFLLKKLYDAISPQYPKITWRSIVIHPCIHLRHKFTLWLALQHRLPAVRRLAKIGIQVPIECVLCWSADETHDHLYMKCNVTRSLWRRLLLWMGVQRNVGGWNTEVEWVAKQAKGRSAKSSIISSVFGMVSNLMWRTRNSIRFQQGSYNEDQVCREIAIHVHIQSKTHRKWEGPLQQQAAIPWRTLPELLIQGLHCNVGWKVLFSYY